MSWETMPLGNFLTLKRGYDLPNSKRENGSVPIVSSSGITGYHNQAKVAGPGVVTGRYGTLGEVFFILEDFWPLNTALYVQDFKGNDRRFSAYFLKHILKGTLSDKAAVPGVNRNDLHSRKVKALTDHREQCAIADILSTYDDLIENNWRRIALLEQAARMLYQEWFVHLRFPGHEHVKITNGLPEGWAKSKVSDVFQLLGGYPFKSKTYQDCGKYGIVTIKNVHDANFIPECTAYIDEPPSNMGQHCHLSTDDILLSLTGNIGRACIVFGENYLLNQRVAKVVPNEKIPRSYVYWCLRDDEMQRKLENLAYGVAQQNLSPIKLGEQEFVRPSYQIVELFHSYVSNSFDLICSLNLANQKLEQGRDLLLPRLMNGEIAV